MKAYRGKAAGCRDGRVAHTVVVLDSSASAVLVLHPAMGPR